MNYILQVVVHFEPVTKEGISFRTAQVHSAIRHAIEKALFSAQEAGFEHPLSHLSRLTIDSVELVDE